MNAEMRLRELGLELPEVPKPAGELVLPKCLSIVSSGVSSSGVSKE